MTQLGNTRWIKHGCPLPACIGRRNSNEVIPGVSGFIISEIGTHDCLNVAPENSFEGGAERAAQDGGPVGLANFAIANGTGG